MNKFRKNNKLNYLKYGALVLLLMLTLGYALLSANLNITGTSNFARTTWNIHFENLVPSTNMTLAQGEGASITQNKTTEVTYTLNFTEPGQYYEFLVDAKNDGSLDGMVNAITSTIKIGNDEATPITTNPSNLPAYLEYSASYSDGTPIQEYHLLESGDKETYKIRIAFSTDIDATDLPGTAESIELTFVVEYVQKDSNAVPSHPDTGIYTVNKYNSSTKTPKYNGVWLNQGIHESIIQYNTPSDALTAIATASSKNLPFYLKHKIENGIVTESYVEFVVTPEIAGANTGMVAGTYTLRGEKTYDNDTSTWLVGTDYISPYYEANNEAIKTAFGYSTNPSRCHESGTGRNSYFVCSVSGLLAYAGASGGVNAHGNDSSNCSVTYDGNSYCLW